jgi:hypothetical protein
MPPEQIRVLQQWLNEVLAKGDLATKVTEKEMEGQLSLLHKGGPKAEKEKGICKLQHTSGTGKIINF